MAQPDQAKQAYSLAAGSSGKWKYASLKFQHKPETDFKSYRMKLCKRFLDAFEHVAFKIRI